MQPDFDLASRSPRRVQMLREAGLSFECRPADIDETPRTCEAPAAFARRMAQAKARAAFDAGSGRPCLGADTDVALQARILGKPRDAGAAVEMLLALADRSHHVHSAVALVGNGLCEVLDTCTEVRFGPISAAQARAYWDSGEPAGKAGAYAIQGLASRWVREVHGSYTGVVGLPLFETLALLARHGVHPRAAAAAG